MIYKKYSPDVCAHKSPEFIIKMTFSWRGASVHFARRELIKKKSTRLVDVDRGYLLK